MNEIDDPIYEGLPYGRLVTTAGRSKSSELTFKDVSKNLAYIKVIWNGKTVFDDTDGEAFPEDYKAFEDTYNDKIVYSMTMRVVEFHHCILSIKGEK